MKFSSLIVGISSERSLNKSFITSMHYSAGKTNQLGNSALELPEKDRTKTLFSGTDLL